MNKITKVAVCLALPLTSVMLSAGASAATATTTVTVSAIVVDSCVVDATPLAFGDYNGISGGMLDAVATITPTCTSGTAYAVALDAGLGDAATQTSRKLTGPDGVSLNYGIFTDATRLTVWGDGTAGTSWNVGAGTGAAQPVTMYGRVPASQSAMVGSYTDTITVTVSY